MRTIKAIHKAVYEPIADLITYRAMPSASLPMNAIDPFIFLNHHGHQEYLPKNNGLPFGPHPHRGFETVTFILEGDLVHKDSSGHESIIHTGGVQWMVAGKGLIHAEISSDEFKSNGGPLEILQLWINLPSKYKMTDPSYRGLQQKDIPWVWLDGNKAIAYIIFGDWKGAQAPLQALTDIHLARIDFKEGGKTGFFIPKEKNILFYVVKGTLSVNGKEIQQHDLAVFAHDDESVEITALTDAIILFGHATPFHEPFFAYGPFVMNTRDEIRQAYDDYNTGKFGSENNF
ncbi:MAG: pirin family protein [Bacteroidota bacterium]|nr:pirin family protein [Bacteroidota bacterium]